jgi:signal transduction histidine kinase
LGIAVAQLCAQALERTRLLAAERDARTEAEHSADRTARLQRVTAALAATVTTDDVSQAMLDHGLAAVGATAGVVCRLNDTATVIDRVWALGYPADGLEAFRKMALTVALPPRDVVQTRAPVFVESPAHWLERYLPPAPGMEIAPAAAGLPLLVGERLVGVMVLRFPEPRSFSPADQTQILSVASQCAQAMERARLHESERAARARADEANRAKTEFLAVMSHELRTPLNAIAGYAELLEIGVHGPLTDPQRDAIGRIQRSQRHLLGLINDVLNFARIDAGHIELDLSDVPVDESLAALEALLAPQVRSKQLRYRYEPCDPTLTAYADPEKVRQILLNLLSNAIKFTRPGGEVTLSCAADVQVVRIGVADSGSGVPADKLDRIFEPFVQLDAGRTRSHEGTGLGLAISRDLARAMHGEIGVTSSVGVGSTFTLTLPRRVR